MINISYPTKYHFLGGRGWGGGEVQVLGEGGRVARLGLDLQRLVCPVIVLYYKV